MLSVWVVLVFEAKMDITFLEFCLYSNRTAFIVRVLVLLYLVFIKDIMHHMSVKAVLFAFILLAAVIFSVNTAVCQILMQRFMKT